MAELLSVEAFVKKRGQLLQIIETCQKSLEKLHLRCPHDWTYERDPSGNNDSGWSCRLCHKQSHRRPEGAK